MNHFLPSLANFYGRVWKCIFGMADFSMVIWHTQELAVAARPIGTAQASVGEPDIRPKADDAER